MELLYFYLLAFGISWLGWVPQTLHARGIISFSTPMLTLLGGAGPTLAAVLTLLLLKQRERIPALFKAVLDVQARPAWIIFTLSYWPLMTLAVLWIGKALRLYYSYPLVMPWFQLIPVFVTMLFSNVWEEIGWRGFALPRFRRWSDMSTALIMGVLWSLWHLPLLLDPTSPMAGLPWSGEVAFSLALSVIYIWLYRHTRGSLAYVTLFHALSNTAAFVLLRKGVFIQSYGFVVGLTVLMALGILLRHGARRFGPDIEAAAP